MSDFQVKVGGDFTEVLRGFQSLPAAATQAGDGIGRSLNEPIKDSTKSLAALQNELRALKASQAKLPLDSSEYRAAGAEIDKLKTQISALASKTTKLPVDATDAPAAANQFRLLDGVVQGIAFSLSNTLTNAAGAALQAVSDIPRTISQFDTARAAVSTLGVNTDELGRNLANLSRELGNNVSQVELMEAAYDVASSGFSDAASNTEVMRAAALLATGGFTDLQTAGDGLTSVLNAYGLSAEDATKVTDGIIQTQNDGKIVAGEYAREIGRLAPTAKASGVSLEELNAAISGATAQGVPVGSTFAGIQQAIVSILKPSQDASQYAKELGIEWNASALQAKGLGGFLQQLVDRGAASSEAIIRLTGSTEAQTALMPLLNDGLQKYNQFLDNQRGSAGAAADASEKATATIDGSLKRLQNTISNLTVETFAGLAPIVAGAINVVSGFVEAIAAVPTPIKVLGGVLVGLAGTFAATAIAVAAFNSTLVQGQIAAAGAAITSLSAAISGTLGAVVPVATAAMTKLLAAIVAVSTTQFTFAGIAAAVQTGIVAAANAGTAAFANLTAAITSGSLISGIQAFAASTKALLVTMAPLALAVGAVAAAVGTWQYVLGGANKINEDFADSQQEVDDVISKLNLTLGESKVVVENTNNAFTRFFQAVREEYSLLELQKQAETLQGKFTATQTSAIEFYNTIKDSGQITDEQRIKAQAYITALEAIAKAASNNAEKFRLLAEQEAQAGNPALAENYRARAAAMDSEANASNNLIAALKVKLGITEADAAATKVNTEATEEAKKAAEERVKVEAELNRVLAEAPVRNLEAQLAIGKELLSLSQALADREESRFAVTKAGLEYELAQAEKRGASEAEIGTIKERIQDLDRQALEARFKALQQEQALQVKMLALSQEKAQLEADLGVQEQRLKIKEAEANLAKAASEAEKALAQTQLDLETEKLGIREQQKALLQQTQPIEKQILGINQETADNNLRAKAAQEGYKIAADGTLVAVGKIAASSDKIKQLTEARKKTEQEIVAIIADSTSRQATRQIEVGQRLLTLAQALSAEQQTRFDLVRSALDFELKKAEERGASESEIGAIKAKIQQNDAAAAQARYSALLEQQQLEAQILAITQKKQAIDANLEYRKQQIEVLKAESELRKSIASNDRAAVAAAEAQVNLQRLILGVKGEQITLLLRTQPIEAQILASQQQTAINAERAKAAQNGYQLAAASSAVSIGNILNSAIGISDATAYGATQQQRMAGYTQVASYETQKAANAALGLTGNLDDAQAPAQSIASAFVTTGERAPAAAQGARDFAAWLSQAKVFAEQIAALPIADQMAVVAQRTEQASRAAQVFYTWLERASRLPGSRWTGGPVAAGEQYRVNELGQEALLSGGRLSLINAAPNSIWRAPTNGTVIPAGITARLQEQGALAGRGAAAAPLSGGGNSAALAVEIGKLRQEVGELARKQWNVNVTTKTGPTGSQVLRQMMR